MDEVLKLTGISISFGALKANDSISLSLASGEILALLGENGAGKTTLMNIIFGHYVADEGSVEVRGKRWLAGSSEAAIKAGIGMVHQHFTLAENLTVLENIILGREPLWSLWHKLSAGRKKLLDIASRFGLEVQPDAKIGDLTIGQRQRVEILKALYADAEILILDEPTAVLTPQETDSLFVTLRNLVSQGKSAIIISHKLDEILKLSDRIAVLRRGKVVATLDTKDANRSQLAEMMVGRKVVRPKAEPITPGKPLLSLKGISVATARASESLANFNLTVREHEIVGLAGVAGNGQNTLSSLVCGERAPDSGNIELLGSAIEKFDCRTFVNAGIGRIPEDRHSKGIIGDMAVWENLISEDLRQPPFLHKLILLDKAAGCSHADTMIDRFDIRCSGPLAETQLLSGGNLQRLILARGLNREPKFIIANQPSRGLDEGAIAYVQGQLLDARRSGAGILLISEDLDELLSLADRVLVIYRGQIQEASEVEAKDVAKIGLMMSGQGAA